MSEYWKHVNGDVYAVMLDDGGKVERISGPLDHSEVTHEAIVEYNFDDDPQDAEWANEHLDEFTRTLPQVG